MDDRRIIPIKSEPSLIGQDDILHSVTQVTSFEKYKLQNKSINLRAVVADIVAGSGHPILFRRSSQYLHCVFCWDSLNREANNDCVYCGGTGRVTVLEKLLTRRMEAMYQTARARNVKATPPGHEAVVSYIFFFEYNVNPAVKDIIYEVTWNSGTPKVLLTEYRINYAEDMRDERGRIEYWRCGVESRPLNKTIHSINIRRLRNNITNEYYYHYDIGY